MYIDKIIVNRLNDATPILTGVVIRQRLFLEVLEKIWTELLLQTVTVIPEQTLDTIPNQREKIAALRPSSDVERFMYCEPNVLCDLSSLFEFICIRFGI